MNVRRLQRLKKRARRQARRQLKHEMRVPHQKLHDIFRDKKVLIMGAAPGLFHKMNQAEVNLDDYDLVIKCNHHWCQMPKKWDRVDIIYSGLRFMGSQKRHLSKKSFDKLLSYEENEVGLPDILVITFPRKQSISHIASCFNNGVRYSVIEHKKFLWMYRHLKCLPLMGVSAILHAAMHGPRLIHCFGFDFYTSGKYYKARKRSNQGRLIAADAIQPALNWRRNKGGLHKLPYQQKAFKKLLKFHPILKNTKMIHSAWDIEDYKALWSRDLKN